MTAVLALVALAVVVQRQRVLRRRLARIELAMRLRLVRFERRPTVHDLPTRGQRYVLPVRLPVPGNRVPKPQRARG